MASEIYAAQVFAQEPGTEPRPQRWEARVLPLYHRGPHVCSGVVHQFIYRYLIPIYAHIPSIFLKDLNFLIENMLTPSQTIIKLIIYTGNLLCKLCNCDTQFLMNLRLDLNRYGSVTQVKNLHNISTKTSGINAHNDDTQL